MSLKTFHIFFITVAVLASLGFCAWAFTLGGATVGSQLGLLAIGSVVLAVVLAVYGTWFVFKKASKIIV